MTSLRLDHDEKRVLADVTTCVLQCVSITSTDSLDMSTGVMTSLFLERDEERGDVTTFVYVTICVYVLTVRNYYYLFR